MKVANIEYTNLEEFVDMGYLTGLAQAIWDTFTNEDIEYLNDLHCTTEFENELAVSTYIENEAEDDINRYHKGI